MKKWYVVASRTRTRIYQHTGPTTGLDLIETLENPDGRVRGREMHRHKLGAGVARGKAGQERTYSLESASDPHELVAVQFAKKIASFLDKKVQKKAFDQVVLVAEPHVLGLIKKELTTKTVDSLGRSIRKDLNKISDTQLPKHLGVKPKPRLMTTRR